MIFLSTVLVLDRRFRGGSIGRVSGKKWGKVENNQEKKCLLANSSIV